MAMNADHFHTHDNFKIAGKIIDQVSALKQRNAELEKENAALKEERRWRKFSEENPDHHQWIFVINPDRSKHAPPIETRRWDDGMKFDVEAQELYKVWIPQMKVPEE